MLLGLGFCLRNHDLYAAVKEFSKMLEESRELFEKAPAIEFTIAGWQGSKPAVWYMVTRDAGDYQAMAFYEIPTRYQGGAMGSPDAMAWEALGVVEGAPDDTLRANGVRIMEALRHLPGKVFGKEDLPAVYGVGGHVQYVRLDPDGGCENIMLHEWPDEIGKKIAVGAI